MSIKKKKKKIDKQPSEKYLQYAAKYENHSKIYKSVKTSLSSIINEDMDLSSIQFSVNNINNIVIHAYQFIKMYCLYKLDHHNDFPVINTKLINTVMKILCKRSKNGSKPSEETKEIMKPLRKFKHNHYNKTLVKPLELTYKHMNTVMDYQAQSMMTGYENHITEHFEHFLNRYINVMVDKKEHETIIRNAFHKKSLKEQIENDIEFIKVNCPSDLTNELHIKYLENCISASNYNETLLKQFINNQEFNKIKSKQTTNSDYMIKKILLNKYRYQISLIKKDILEGTDKCNSKYNDLKIHIRKDILPFVFSVDSYILENTSSYMQKLYHPLCTEVMDDIHEHITNNLPKKDMEKLFEKIPTNKRNEKLNKHTQFKIIRQIKKDILNRTDNCDIKYKQIRNKANDLIKKIDNNYLLSDVKNNPLYYLPALVKMSREIELKNKPTFNCFPLRKSLIPKYIKIDTTTLAQMLNTFTTDVKTNQDNLWNMFVDTNKKVFRMKGYKFNHSILTDGVGCSLLFIRNDKYKADKVVHIQAMKKPFNYNEFKYMNKLTENEIESIKDMKIVSNDPGKIRLLSMTDGNVQLKTRANGNIKHQTTLFTYSQVQRNAELKTKKYNKIREELSNKKIKDNLTIKNLETILTNYSSKSTNYNECVNYIIAKNIVNYYLEESYQETIYRKLNWYSWINKRKSEDRLMNKFKKKFGGPEEVIIATGDFSENKPMKGFEPTKGKSFRKLFKKHGYKCYLINEYNTSKKNFLTGNDNEKFRKRVDINNNMREVHGLLRSENVTNKDPYSRHILLNRDLNGAMNILKKANCILNNKQFPTYLRMPKKRNRASSAVVN